MMQGVTTEASYADLQRSIEACEFDPRQRRVVITLKDLKGVCCDTIARIAFSLFQMLYRGGCTGNSRIHLELKQGYYFEPGRPLASTYFLKIPSPDPKATFENSISHAYAFIEPDKHTGFISFFLNEAIDVQAIDQALSSHFVRKHVQEPPTLPIIQSIQRIINYILSLGCIG